MYLRTCISPTVSAELERELPKRVLAFDSLCGARTGVAKRVLAFDRRSNGG